MEMENFIYFSFLLFVKRICYDDGDKKKFIDNSIKKIRLKCGQYRKYNSQLLMEVVKVVQRGEMSVYRVGSYYGVLYLILEYKVKERYFFRQKKIKEQREQREVE